MTAVGPPRHVHLRLRLTACPEHAFGTDLDHDDDDDGTLDTDDAFPLDECADTDTDGDGLNSYLDTSCSDVETTIGFWNILYIDRLTTGEPSITLGEAFESNDNSVCDARSTGTRTHNTGWVYVTQVGCAMGATMTSGTP